jgi:hypothetical protein
VVTVTIPASKPKLREPEIAFSCHLDHQRPVAFYERTVSNALDAFASTSRANPQPFRSRAKGEGAAIFRRLKEPRAPLVVFGYD